MCPKILIVEDDIALQQMLAWELEDLGYRVTATGSCRSCRALFESRSFDLALLDYSLPDGNGIELIYELLRVRPNLPVIMFSGAGCQDVPEHALRSGAVYFVAKPASSALLHRLFQRVLGNPVTH